MQGTRVRALVREDATCRGATKPMRHNYRAHTPRARDPQQKKPLQWEVCAPQQSSPHSQLEKARAQQRRPNAAKNKQIK